MAASAYLTSSAEISSSERPSIFQLLASDALAKAILPALKQFLRFAGEIIIPLPFLPSTSFRFASSRCHGRLRFLQEYCDEVSLLFQILLQQHQLRHHHALFEEHFYGLKRASDGRWRTERRMARALIFSLIAPYLKTKMDNLFEKAREDEVDGVSCRSPLLTRSRRLFLFLYPYLHVAFEASVFVYYLAYALEKVTICQIFTIMFHLTL